MAVAANGTASAKNSGSDGKEKIGLFYWGGKFDIPMFVIIMALFVMGVTMMFSASHALAYKEFNGDSFQYIRSQLRNGLIGVGIMLFLSAVDYKILRREFHLFGMEKLRFTLTDIAFWISMVLLTLVLFFGVSNTVGGPIRWLRAPIIERFQPSDIVKMTLIMFTALYIHRNYDLLRYFKHGIFKPMCLFAVIALLLMWQPHLSCVVIMFCIGGGMIYVGGINHKYMLLAVPVIVLGIVALVAMGKIDYIVERLINTFDPTSDIENTTYQSYQAVLAIGSGGFWGVGFGNSVQKFSYLPEAQNDFVFAVICEECGFVGGMMVMLMFLIFGLRGFYIARRSSDRFGMFLATGITIQVVIQALLNIGVNVSCIPNTGISLPFFSYGGTALIIQLAEAGLLLSVSRQAQLD